MGNHHPNGHALQNNIVGGQGGGADSVVYPLQNQQQLFLPGTMKMQMVRKSPATQHQQHRSHSVNNQVQLQLKQQH